MKKQIIIMIIISMLLLSCIATKTITKGSYVNLTSNVINTEVSAEQIGKIRIFYKTDPDFQYTEIGIVEAIARGKEAGLEDLFPELKKQAAIIGSDAVYKIEIQRYNQTGDALHATGIAIKSH